MGVTFSALNLKIGDTGGDQTIKKLDAIDSRVEKMSETSRKAFAAMTKQEQEAFLRWESGAKAAAVATDQATASAARATVAVENVGAAATTMNTRAARATQGVARGFEMVARTGALTGRSLDAVLSNVSQLALGFGSTGLLIGAIGIGTAAIVEMFNRTRKELEKTQTEFSQRLVEMGRASNLIGLEGRFGTATQLKSGDPFMRTLGRKAFPQLNDVEFLKQSGGIEGLTAERNRLNTVLASGSMFRQGSKDGDRLRDVTKALTEAQTEYNNALKIGQMVQDKITAEDEAGRRLKAAQDLAEAEKKADAEREQRERYLAKANLGKQFDDATLRALGVQTSQYYGQAGAKIEHKGLVTAAKLVPTPDEKDAKDTIAQWQKYADQVGRGIANTIGDAIGAGFEALFEKGGSLKNGFKALTGTLLAGLGDMFEQAGKQALLGLSFIKTIVDSIATMNPAVGIAAAVGLIALGAALKGAGGRVSASASGGGGGSANYSSPSLGGTIIVNPRGASGTSSVAGMEARPSNNFYVSLFGKDDPRAQRELLEMIDRGQRRRT